VVLKPSANLSEEQLVEFAAARLAKYKVPAHVRFIPELPLGLTGKVDKKRLRAIWDDG
jgi:acyl-CoA synthetase (AMP-forming)/AMP-acid ligase II